MNLYEDLEYRGMIKDCSSPELKEKLNKGGLTFYIGADPTAKSLHIGQFPTFLLVERLKRAGHKAMILVGGATGRVGDPRGTGEREKAEISVIESNFERIKKQMTKLFGEDIQIVNNFDWFKDMNYIDFLRDVGKYINVNYMVNKDLVKRQMEVGISYAEFSYMLIQGYDFKYLHDHYGVDLQFGGSDQWGNLTTGIEIVRKLNNEEVLAFSAPLITDSTGKKLGKSYGNALWLDKDMTSSYEMYQYLLNFEDVMMEEYLKKFTFLTKLEIEEIMKKHVEKPEFRYAQKVLAHEVITFLHGEEEFESAKRISESLFSEEIEQLSAKDILENMKDVPQVELLDGENIVEALVRTKIVSSKREAREMISAGAISFNNKKVMDLEYVIQKDAAIEQQIFVLKKGKKNMFIGTF